MPLLKLRFSRIISRPWNITFEDRLLHGSCYLHVLTSLTKRRPFFIIFDKLSSQIISAHRSNVFIKSNTKIFISVSERGCSSNFGRWQLVKWITSKIKNILQYFSWGTKPLALREWEFVFWGWIIEGVCGKVKFHWLPHTVLL